MKRNLLLLFIILFASCAQWRVSDLTSSRILSIPAGEKIGSVTLDIDDQGLKNLTTSVNASYSRMTVADNIASRLYVYDENEKLTMVIGGKLPEETKEEDSPKEMIQASFDFSSIGVHTSDKWGNIYAQNRLNRVSAGDQGGEFSPSYILAFNEAGQLMYTLGKNGTPDIPFYYIEDIHVDEKGRLFVISRSFDSWHLYRYRGKELDVERPLDTLPIDATVDGNSYTSRIEDVRVYNRGEKLLISVAYYYGKRFKMRRIYDYSIETNKIMRTIVELADPKNVLLDCVDNKYLHLWDHDGDAIRFMVLNMEGVLVNNLSLTFPDNAYYYETVMTDNRGSLFSYHISRDAIDIFSWK